MTVASGVAAVARARILLIEDEPSVAAFLRIALERRGYEVVPSASAVEGLQLLATGDFRGVVSDFRTPGGITGADVHDWLERHRPELASLALAGTPCVEKPFRVQQLMAAVEKTIGKP